VIFIHFQYYQVHGRLSWGAGELEWIHLQAACSHRSSPQLYDTDSLHCMPLIQLLQDEERTLLAQLKTAIVWLKGNRFAPPFAGCRVIQTMAS